MEISDTLTVNSLKEMAIGDIINLDFDLFSSLYDSSKADASKTIGIFNSYIYPSGGLLVDKIKDSSYEFGASEEDEAVLENFFRNVSAAKKGIGLNNFINNVPSIASKNGFKLADMVNEFKAEASCSYDTTKYSGTMFPHTFAVIKTIQKPADYTINYHYWQTMTSYLLRASVSYSYKELCLIYQKIQVAAKGRSLSVSDDVDCLALSFAFFRYLGTLVAQLLVRRGKPKDVIKFLHENERFVSNYVADAYFELSIDIPDKVQQLLNEYGGKISKIGTGAIPPAEGEDVEDGSKDETMSSATDNIPLNIILYGPPGTGKTYNTIYKTLDILKEPVVCVSGATKSHETWYNNDEADRDKALEKFNVLKENGRVVFTTFHQSMSYEDFIEGIKPILDGKSVGYEIMPGIFKHISEAAADDPANNYVLIIDEINRGNVANIFGELITLIEEDKRLGNSEKMTCKLPYSKKKFGVPKNLYIIGTMNTADRSVEALDTALRRRFTFEEMMPKPGLLGKTVDGVNLQEFLTVINRRISLLKDREHQIGHSYFMKVNSKETLIDVIFKNVIPLLQEYFYGDYEKIQMVLGKTFIPEDDTLKVDFAASSGSYEPEKVYRIAEKDDINIDDALESINFGYKKASSEKTEETPEDAE